MLKREAVTVNTKEAVALVAKKMGCYHKDARELLLEHFPAVLVEAVSAGKKVHLAGLGRFTHVGAGRACGWRLNPRGPHTAVQEKGNQE